MQKTGKVRGKCAAALIGGVAVAVLLTVGLILLFAVCVLLWDFGFAVISPVNQVIKVVSILLGTFVAAKKMQGWKAGLCVGGLYMALGIAVYCALDGKLLPVGAMAGDMGLGLVTGALSGMLAGSFKK